VDGVLRREHETASATVRAQHADGSWRWLEIQLSPILDADGTIAETHSAARDVPARLQAQQQLAHVAEQVRSIVDSCADALISIDEHGRVLDWNPAAEQTSGWAKQEAVGAALAAG
jgi:PAS domain-containing protein